MKLYLLLLILIFSLEILFAKNISVEQAYAIANSFFQTKRSHTATIDLQLIWNGKSIYTREGVESPSYYIFNNVGGKGFVIVAGDDAALPILGYSFVNNFDPTNIPPNLMDWLEMLHKEINKVRQNPTYDANIRQAWSTIRAGNIEEELETAKWNQFAPYNNDCPERNGKKLATGCVITAVAIVMRFHQWPDYGSGTIPGYTTETLQITLPDRELGHAYDWSNMPLSYNGEYTDKEASAVATLMFDCGMMLQADYGLDGTATAASLSNVLSALVTYMKYDKSACFLKRAVYTTDDWYSLLKKELKEKRPIIYRGAKDKGGHAFILDGYTTDNYFHVNWGHSGNHNGYYTLSALGYNEENYYNANQWAIIGLKKDEGNPYQEILRFSNKDTELAGFFTSAPFIHTNKPFDLTGQHIRNFGSDKFTGTITWALTNKLGEIKLQLVTYPVENLSPLVYLNLKNKTKQVTITVPIQGGDRIRAFYKSKKTPDWTLIKGNEEENTSWELVLINDDVTIEESTSIIFNKQTKIFTLQIKDGVNFQLFNADNNIDVTKFCKIQNNEIQIDTKSLQTGSYIIKLQKEREYKELQFLISNNSLK